ncbi:TolC family protein [Pontiellaceae bacterium B12219]|nr:TolC family protein [Pontiellaceae bacterium B12219]
MVQKQLNLILGSVLVLILTSCTKVANYAEERADLAAYGNIRGAQLAGMGTADPFTINDAEHERIRELLAADQDRSDVEQLSLSETLAIAMANSRTYQYRKETLFLLALNLSETQKDFNWNYTASASASTGYDTFKDGTAETFGDQGVDSSLAAGVGRTLASGARVSLGFTQNYLNLLSSPDTSGSNNGLSFNIVQPLLNGFGPLVTMEPLKQAERDLVYAVRDFKRYQQDFVIDISSQYYSTLRARDQLYNERRNYESSIVNREQTESYAKAGRIADFQAAQARQSELNAADRWSLALSSYEQALDDFRFTLGLPIDLKVEPDPAELEQLSKKGLVELDITLDEAMTSALSNRLDLINRRQQVEDRERKLEIAKRNFLPKMDVDYNVSKSFDSASGEDVDQDLSVRLNLPFDWTEKRNNYRRSQITLEREIRTLEQETDEVQLEVRDLWRKLERNRSVYNNRLLSVQLSERQVENTKLLLQQGKALTRDVLDAEEDLLNARNQTTVALVDYTINRLRFWNAIERFQIDPKGMWYEQVESEEAVATP